ncbi:MAG: thiamine pyrophosphate-dependent dehydrogenase E1 component subunit alpha [Candidatus Staskawiczbacteria bacterium]|nr:thiamine pyrophosphate-dependent dehydrogenase E1 component subunit alpha [Candidatus Staskawiczbacteria bacterium]
MPKIKPNKKEINLNLFKTVDLIRSAEKGITKYYHEDDMKTPMHMSMGEEAITAGVCHALNSKDQVFGYYRSHALYISKAHEVRSFFGEMYGKETGCVRGRGGSMHLANPNAGLMMISAIVSSTIAPAVGASFANKVKRNGKIVAVFFGDGAVEEGVFFESLNFACLMKLPIIFVCQDNELAVDVLAKERQGFKSIPDIVKSFDCNFISSQSTDAEEIYELTNKALDLIKKNKKPAFMHLKYYRMLQHIGVISDFDKDSPRPKGGFERENYRSKKEYDEWFKKDPLKVLKNKLLKLGVSEEKVSQIEKENYLEVEESIKLAKEAPFPKKSELFDYIYAKE